METAKAQKDAVLKFRNNFRRNPALVPIHKLQEHAARPRPVKGPIWVSSADTLDLEAGEDRELRSKLWEVFEQRGDGTEEMDYPVAFVPLHGEWIGFRKEAVHGNPLPRELDQFEGMQRDCDKSTTIFYLSGSGWMSVIIEAAEDVFVSDQIETQTSRISRLETTDPTTISTQRMSRLHYADQTSTQAHTSDHHFGRIGGILLPNCSS